MAVSHWSGYRWPQGRAGLGTASPRRVGAVPSEAAGVSLVGMDPVRQEASPVGGKVALLAGGLAISATAWYLAAGFPSTLINLAVALAVVLWSLRSPWPLNRRRLTRVAIWWLAGGLLGAYFFGVFVLLAGLAVAVAVAVESLRTGASNNG